MTIGEKISFFRNNKDLTQKKLAELSGISEISIRKYEAGERKPKKEQVLKLAHALNMNPSFFYEEELRAVSFETVGDLMAVFYALKEQLGLEWDYHPAPDGQIDISSIRLKFVNSGINHLIGRVIDQENTLNLYDKAAKTNEVERPVSHDGTKKALINSPALLAEIMKE